MGLPLGAPIVLQEPPVFLEGFKGLVGSSFLLIEPLVVLEGPPVVLVAHLLCL